MPNDQHVLRRTALRDVKVGKTNAGLWLNKYFDGTEKPGQSAAQSKSKHFEALTKLVIPDGYPHRFAAHQRWLEESRDAGDVSLGTATTEGRMIIGLGAKAAAEAGIQLDHTWGMPLLPGSALKGLAAATAHRLYGGTWAKGEKDKTRPPTDFDWLFGTTAASGAVIFHDAWWKPEGETLPFDLDVMTVHHTKYYGGATEDDGVVAPSDFDSPTPIPFLTARGTYLVAVEGPEAWRETAFELLEKGLAELGIGAKTSSGYGRFKLERLESEANRVAHAEAEKRAQAKAGAPAKLQAIGTAAKDQKQKFEEVMRLLFQVADDLGQDQPSIDRLREIATSYRAAWKDWSKKENRTERQKEFLKAALG